MEHPATSKRAKLFLSKATPGDDAFALWLAPRLEAEGYAVFADILSLSPADGWRLKITDTLQDEAIKMLLCCSDETLKREGVIEEIEIAKDLVRSLKDDRFLVPLKMKRFKKIFGIGSLQYIDFERSWAEGLTQLLKFLDDEGVPKSKTPNIQPTWADYQKRQAVEVSKEPEVLTSNWLRVIAVPDCVNLIKPKGSISKRISDAIASDAPFPLVPYADGFFTFAECIDFCDAFPEAGSFEKGASVGYEEFSSEGNTELGIAQADARRVLMNLFRQAWELHLRKCGFLQHAFSNGTASIVSEGKAKIKQRIKWGRQGQRRNSMLRNVSKGKVWEYGVSALPSLFPFPHYRLKGRVLFSEARGPKQGPVIDDHKTQHRLRRSVCSGWRNKAWHGRLMAFMELLAGESPYVSLPVGNGQFITLDGMPIQVTAPISARQRFVLGEDAEETDLTTIGGHFSEDDA